MHESPEGEAGAGEPAPTAEAPQQFPCARCGADCAFDAKRQALVCAHCGHEQAVEDGILAKSSLAVPYGNLATMYQYVGETSNAIKFANMAKALSASSTPPAQQPGRTTAQQVTNGRTGMIQTGGQQPGRMMPRR